MKNKYVLLLLLSTIYLYPSEKMQRDECGIDQLVQIVRDTIDEKLLGIPKNAFCRSARGALWSFIRCSRLYKTQMIAELQKIESYIPESSCDRQLLFKKLIACHGYFYWLMDCMVESNLQALNLLCAVRIDALNELVTRPCNGLSNKLNSFIADHTKRRYAGLHTQMMSNFQDIPFNVDCDIHHMPLCVDYVVEKIDLSVDGGYVSARGAERTTVWNTRDGKVVDSAELRAIKWRNNTDPYVCENDHYCIVNGKDLSFKKTWNSATLAIAYGLSSERDGRVVSLFTKPTYESLLCQRALLQSFGSTSSLQALGGSVLVEQLRENFPKLQLKNTINAQLKKLE